MMKRVCLGLFLSVVAILCIPVLTRAQQAQISPDVYNEMKFRNSRVLFAGMWQLEIHTYGRKSAGPGSGLFKSTGGGVTWKRLEGHGLPHAPIGRIAVRVAPKDSNRVYALIETGDGVPMDGKPTQSGQLWRSDDRKWPWEKTSKNKLTSFSKSINRLSTRT